jgi:signal transduction histidine kinase
VSHELRSPLTSIKGAMGLLLSKATGELPPKAVGMLEIAHRNADRLILIINDILDLEKISSGEMEFELQDTDMAEIVREACKANDMLQQRFGVTLRTVGCDDPLPVRTDPNRIIQVLTNLLTNAYKFSKPGGTITIEINQEDSQLRVSVQDEGAGIPASEQHKIFERFADMTNADRATKGGTGLGLNICKAIIEGLGGTIEFESKEGVGSTFNILLPKTLVLYGPADPVEKLKKAS